MDGPPTGADHESVGVSGREPAYPIFMSQRSRPRRGAYVLALALMLVALIVLRLV